MKWQVINAVVFEERGNDVSLKKLLGSLAKQPCRFSGWSINIYEMEFN